MARDASGNYTLPAGNPVISGTLIESNWANPTMSDIGNEMTDSLSRTGKGGMLSQFKSIDGTVANPGISFLDQLSLGMYRAASSDMRVSVAGTDSMRWVSTGPQIWDGAQWNDILTQVPNTFDGPDPTLNDENAALITGTTDPVNDPHLAYGLTTIQAKSTSTIAAAMSINPYGGDTLIGARSGIGPTGEVQIWHDGVQSIRTIDAGITVGLSSTKNIQIANNVIDSLNNGVAEPLSINTSGADVTFGDPTASNITISGDAINSDNNGSPASLRLNQTGTTVSQYDNGTEVTRTIQAVSGGLLIVNDDTGSGLERALTESDKSGDAKLLTASRNIIGSDSGAYLIRDAAGDFTLTVGAGAFGSDGKRFGEVVIDNIDDVHTNTITIAASGTTIRTDSGGSLVLAAGETGYLKQISLNVWRLKK